MRILISRKVSDYGFVTSVISRLRLSPRVKDRPTSTDGGERIVERYPWGEVVFMHRAPGEGSTIVAVWGKEQPFPVQECFGHASSTAEECCGGGQEKPCHLLDRCTAVREAAEALKVTSEHLLAHCSVEEVVAGRFEAFAPKPPKPVKRRPHAALTEDEAKLVEQANQFLLDVVTDAEVGLADGG